MKVGRIIRIFRLFDETGLRKLAKEIGISSATLSRVENGKSVDGKTMIKLIKWLF